jgi:hypothetical protein
LAGPDSQLKLSSFLNIAVFNVVAIVLAYLVYSDRVYRLGYWHTLGFTPSTAYYPFFYVTSAVQGSTHIAGLLTIDWLQVILVAMVVVDGSVALGLFRRSRQNQPAPNL